MTLSEPPVLPLLPRATGRRGERAKVCEKLAKMANPLI
jgi:hypothetical protein